jgi:NAD(P)-dependent dehydrogenase (short-subunit alcohol dehydrogenase family)
MARIDHILVAWDGQPSRAGRTHVIHGIRVFVPMLMSNRAGGQVVNTASVGGLVAGVGTGPHTPTKHAVVALSKTNAPWVFPGADRHRALVETEVEDLLAALPLTG